MLHVYKEAKDEYAEHKKAFVHVQSQFMRKFDPCTQRNYLEEAKLFQGIRESARYTQGMQRLNEGSTFAIATPFLLDMKHKRYVFVL